MAEKSRALMQILSGLGVLLGALLAAEWLKHALRLAVPEPVLAVIGLVALFMVLGRVPVNVRQVSAVLLPHMALFFIPALVGLLALSERLAAIIGPLLLIIIVSTLIPLWITAWLFQKLAPPPAETAAKITAGARHADQ